MGKYIRKIYYGITSRRRFFFLLLSGSTLIIKAVERATVTRFYFWGSRFSWKKRSWEMDMR